MDLTIKLWVFPAADFAAWCELVGSTELADHPAYMAMIAAIQADQERQGFTVDRVGMRVASMQSALAARNLPNTPDNRALIVAEQPPMRLLREWHFDFGLATDGQLVSESDCDELLEAIINWAVARGFMIGGGFRPFEKE
jgi:hypothetical protein